MIGIIVFSKSYGRHKNKLLYKFFPNKSEEIYLVPYTVKTEFIKARENKYASVTLSTHVSGKYKIVVLESIIGSVSDFDSYCEYELHCKKLISSKIPFNKTKEKLPIDLNFICEKHQIEHRDEFIFTIDSSTTTDFDDALSVVKTEKGWDISIYISNVPILIDYLNLWNDITKVSTIYLPSKKIGIFPPFLESEFSLKENEDRIVYVMDIHIEKTVSCDFSTKKIKVSKNFIYEENDLLNNIHYQNLTTLVDQLSRYHPISDLVPKNSYDYVAFLMILMNIQCADELDDDGIMRKIVGSSGSFPSHVPNNVQSYLARKQENIYGEYVAFKDSADLYHSLLKVNAYAHITSPIRRIVDIVNLTNLYIALLSPAAKDFCKKWTSQTDFINLTCRNIKLVETNCRLLYECSKNKTYVGYIIHSDIKELKNDLKTDIKELKNDLKTDIKELKNDLKTDIKELKNDLKTDIKELKNDLKTDIKYARVYIPDLKMTARLYQAKQHEEYSKIIVKPIIIVKEFTTYKKIRLIEI